LIFFDIAEEDLIISLMSTQVMLVWEIVKPYREAEIAYRSAMMPDIPHDFLPHYDLRCGARRGRGWGCGGAGAELAAA
jgi:hypothetical protein